MEDVPASSSEAATLLSRPSAPGAGLTERPTVAGYEVLETLGRGGMAVVYKARQVSLGRYVALKMVLAGAHATVEAVARFRTEAEAVAQLQHPNIVQIYEVGAQDGCPFFALEYVEGGTLAEKCAGRPWPASDAATLVETLGRAVSTAHALGIVHRDLKPGNVLLTLDGEPKVADFGLAKRVDSEAAHTRTGAVLGTPGYMAPEQAEGRRDVGPAADVYGLGAILYELLTGRPPFVAETPLDTVLRVLSDDPTPPRKLQPDVPRELETICLKCLEKDPARRYPSAGPLADDLRRFLDGEPPLARPPGVVGRFDRWARQRPALAATLVALVLFYAYHLALLAVGTPDEGGYYHWAVTGIVVAWAVGAAVFQRLSVRSWKARAIAFGWATLDVLMFTLLILVGDGPRSALLPGYLLLTAGEALRLRPGLVVFVTGLSLASYAVVLVEAAWRRPEYLVGRKGWVILGLCLALMGLIQHLLLRRLRASRDRATTGGG